MRSALLERDQALHKVVEQYKTAAEQANLLHQEYTRIQEENRIFTITVQQLKSEVEGLRDQNVNLREENTMLVQNASQQDTTGVTTEQMSSMQKALDENVARIKALERELLDKDTVMVKLKETVTQKDQSLQQMALALSSMGTNGAAKADNQDNVEWTISQQKEEIESLLERIRVKDSSLQQLTEKFNRTSEQLNTLYLEVSALKEKEQDVLVLRETIREKEKYLVHLKETVRIREEKLVVLQQNLAENEDSMKSFLEAQNTSSLEREDVQALQDSVLKLKEEINQKDESLSRVSESCKALTEENTRLKAIEQESYVLVGKLNQTSLDLAHVTEENKQLKQAENEIASLAEQIPILRQEMQRLGKENKDLKDKECEMYKFVDHMKEREAVLGTLNEENAQLKKAVEESKQKSDECNFLSQQVKELENRLSSAEKESVQLQESSSQINIEQQETQQKEIQKYQLEINECKKLLEEKEEFLVNLTENVNSLTSQVANLNQMNESLNEKLRSGKAELETNLQELAEARDLFERKELALLETNKLKDNIEEQLAEKIEENKLLKERQNNLVLLQDSIDSKETELKRLGDVVSSKETQISELTLNVSQLTTTITALNEQVISKTTEMEQMQLDLEQSNLTLVELNVKVQSLSEKHAELEMENRSLKEQVSDYEQLKQTTGSLEEKDNMIIEIQEKLRNKQIELETLQKDHSVNVSAVQDMESTLVSLNHQIETLSSDISAKDISMEEMNSALQLKQKKIDELVAKDEENSAKELEFLNKIESLNEHLENARKELLLKANALEEFQVTINTYSAEIKSLKEHSQQLLEDKESLSSTVSTLTDDLQSVRNENVELLVKVDVGLKAQEEVDILHHSLKERDDKLISLTENIACLSQEVKHLNSVNEALSTRENDLTVVQDRVQSQLHMLNDDITSLKAENQCLSEKEKELIEKETEVGTLKESLEAKHQSLQAKEDEILLLRSELEHMSDKGKSLEEGKRVQDMQADRMKTLETELSEARERNKCLAQEVDRLQKAQDDLTKCHDEKSAELSNIIEKISKEIEDSQAENASLKEFEIKCTELNDRIRTFEENKNSLEEVQSAYNTLSEENKALKEQLNEALKMREQNQEIVAIEQAEVGSAPADAEEQMQVSPSKDDTSSVKHELETNKVDNDEHLEGYESISAVEMVESALESNKEVDKLKNLISEKEQAIVSLHQTVQVQQQGLQQMHQKLTEYSQYVTALCQENEQLKSRGVSLAMETDGSPKQVAEVSTSGEVKHDLADSRQKGSPVKDESTLLVQIEEQKVMLKEFSDQLQVLLDENIALKSQIGSKQGEIPVPKEVQTETQGSVESSLTDVAALHDYIQQQNNHMEQMKQRIIELTHYVNQIQQQNALLQEKDANSTEALQKLTKENEQVASDKQQMEQQQSRDKEELAKASDSLTDLLEENKKLKQKEKESNEVVQHLMSDLEGMKRRKSHSPDSSDGASQAELFSQGELISRSAHDRALVALRAELEEQHGEQIVEMKNQVREQLSFSMEEALKAITTERDEARAQLAAKEQEPTEEQRAMFSHEEMESLHLEIQQLKIKLRDFESERSEYVDKIQDQQERYKYEMQALLQEKTEAQSKLADSVKEIETIRLECNQCRTELDKYSSEKEIYVEQVKRLNERIIEVMTERDEAQDKVGMLENANKEIQSKKEEESSQVQEVNSVAQEQVAEMNRQLKELARERDEALAHIKKQQEQLNTPKDDLAEQSLLHQQVGEALRYEIDSLNAQLQEVTTAKEEAITKIKELEYQVQGQQASHVALPDTPERLSGEFQKRKTSPASKTLSPMQQHLVQLQQQLAQEAPSLPDTAEKTESLVVSDSSGDVPKIAEFSGPGADTDALRLEQIQSIYDEHCKHQAHQIEQLTAELQRTVREKDEMSAQLEQYQKHYENHLQKVASQHKKETEEEIKVINEEMKEVKQTRDDLQMRLESLQTQYKTQLGELGEQVKSWQSKYQDLNQQVGGDASMGTAQMRLENQQLRDSLDELKIKVDAAEKEKEEAQAQMKELKITLYDVEGRDPNVAGYRRRLEDIESTLKVTWIENEELKAEVAVLKSKLSPEELAAHLQNGGAGTSELEDVNTLKARLAATEAELEKIQPLVGIEVIVLTRQIEELKQTYSHQLRIHNQELVSVKRELARYQNLDSDSSDSPIHAIKAEKLAAVKGTETIDSESLSLEMGRFQAEHQLEVEGLKRTKGEVTDELNEEKERHRDAMARIEQLLKKMIGMQQKHKEEVEALKQSHEETIQGMTMEIEQLKLINLNYTSSGSSSPQLDNHLERLVAEKQKLLSERDQFLQERRDWDHERERLKGRIAQIVGEKDLLAKERDALNESIEKVHKDQQELDTQMRLLAAEKQQVLFEREQANYLRQQNAGGDTDNNEPAERIARLQAEVDELRKAEEQVALLEQERALLVNDHKEETSALAKDRNELKLKLDEVQNEKDTMKEQLGFEISELLLKVESLEHRGPRASEAALTVEAMQQEMNKLKEENMEVVKEMQEQLIDRMAEWKLEREKLEEELKNQYLEAAQKQKDLTEQEMEEMQGKLSEVTYDSESSQKERDELRTEREQLMEALKSQESEIVKLQVSAPHFKKTQMHIYASELLWNAYRRNAVTFCFFLENSNMSSQFL